MSGRAQAHKLPHATAGLFQPKADKDASHKTCQELELPEDEEVELLLELPEEDEEDVDDEDVFCTCFCSTSCCPVFGTRFDFALALAWTWQKQRTLFTARLGNVHLLKGTLISMGSCVNQVNI